MSFNFLSHRGRHSDFPENSLSAFNSAISICKNKKKLIGIELDILATRDGQIVICHDNNLYNLCGKNVNITATGYNKLQEFGFINNPQEKIPLLNDLLHLEFSGQQLLIEIKDYEYDYDLFFRNFISILQNLILKNIKIGVISFSETIMKKVIKLSHSLPVSYGYDFKTLDSLAKLDQETFNKLDFLMPQIDLLFKYEDKILQFNKMLIPWTVREKKEIDQLQKMSAADHIYALIIDNIDLV